MKWKKERKLKPCHSATSDHDQMRADGDGGGGAEVRIGDDGGEKIAREAEKEEKKKEMREKPRSFYFFTIMQRAERKPRSYHYFFKVLI